MNPLTWIAKRWPDHWHHISAKNAYRYEPSVAPPNPSESLTRDGVSEITAPVLPVPTSTLTPVLETSNMAITFKSIGHFFAVAYTALKNDLPKVEATEQTVEAVTAVAAGPVYGPLAVTVEKAAYAVLGEISAVLNAGGAAAAAKLADAGLDTSVIQTVQAVVVGVGNVATVAKAL